MGRSLGYTEEHLRLAIEYAEHWEEFGKVPQIARLAIHCGISKQTLYKWEKRDECKKFADVCARVRTEQEASLIDGGLSRDYDSGLAKLMLMKHGYSDRQEVDHKSADGSMSPAASTKEAVQAAKESIIAELNGSS